MLEMSDGDERSLTDGVLTMSIVIKDVVEQGGLSCGGMMGE